MIAGLHARALDDVATIVVTRGAGIGSAIDRAANVDELERLALAGEQLHAAASRLAHFYRVARRMPKDER